MVAYHYDFRIALVKGSPNTVAANATVLVYDLLDTGMTTPVAVYSNPGMTTIINLVTDAHGVVPDFWSERPDLLWKSGTYSGGWATTSSRPGLRGPSGATGPAGPTGPQGTPGLNGGGTNADVAAYIPASGPTRDALDARYLKADTELPESVIPTRLGEAELNATYVTEDATAMQARGYFVALDSFGTDVGGVDSYVDRISAARGMTQANVSSPGAFFQDIAQRTIGTATPATVPVAADSFCHIGSALNPSLNWGLDAAVRSTEKASLEALIWLLATEARGLDSAWTLTGTWSDYTGGGSEATQGGSVKLTSEPDAYAEITPAAGSYVALGYNFSVEVGPFLGTGTYQKNGVGFYSNVRDGGHTTLNGSTVNPRPVPLIGLTGSDVIRCVADPANNYTMVDGLLKLSPTPPWIIISKPTYAASTGYDAAIDAYRSDIDAVVASVTAKYAPLRGKIIVIDPVASGWDRAVHVSGDSLHPNEAGADFLARLTQRQVAYAARLRQQLIATGMLA